MTAAWRTSSGRLRWYSSGATLACLLYTSKVYLDTCSLQRPLDSRTQIRISLEAEAVLGIIALVEDGELELVSSDVLLFETRRNPRAERRAYATEVLDKANAFIEMNSSIRERSVELERNGLKPLDALHLACLLYTSRCV